MIGTTRSFAAAGIAVVLAIVAGAQVSGAQAATPSTATRTDTTTAEHPRMALLCARIPLLIQRTENLQARLDGDENIRGSVARLTMRIEKADERGNADLAAYLTDRLEIRKQRAAIMPEQLELLHKAQATCDEAGS